MSTSQPRKPAGTPVGGQWAPIARRGRHIRSSKHGILFHACLLSSWGRYKLHAGLVLFLGTSFRSAEPVWCLCT